MAMSPSEKQAAYRERLRAKQSTQVDELEKLRKQLAECMAARTVTLPNHDQAVTLPGDDLKATVAEIEKQVGTLPKTHQAKFVRLWNQAKQVMTEMFQAEVRREFERTLPKRIEELSAREKKVTAEIKKYQSMRNGIPAQMSMDDYKFLLGLLHPDRAPNGCEEKYSKAFQIIRRLDPYMKVASKAAE